MDDEERSRRKLPALTIASADVAELSVAELEALLAAEKAYNELLPGPDETRAFFSSLSEREADAFADALRSRLRVETSVLDRYLRLGLDPFAADLCALPLPFPVNVVDEDGDGAETLGEANACYADGAIYLASRPPELAERLAQFATRGVLGNDLFHEVFHGLQAGVEQYQSLADVMGSLADSRVCGDAKVLLAEAHAWLCSLPGFKHDLLATLLSVTYNFERAVLAYAIDLLYSLSVLGLDDAEVASLVGTAVWSTDDGAFADLEAVRERLRLELGLDAEALAAEVERSKLIDRVQAVRGVGIARELVEAMRMRPRPYAATTTA